MSSYLLAGSTFATIAARHFTFAEGRAMSPVRAALDAAKEEVPYEQYPLLEFERKLRGSLRCFALVRAISRQMVSGQSPSEEERRMLHRIIGSVLSGLRNTHTDDIAGVRLKSLAVSSQFPGKVVIVLETDRRRAVFQVPHVRVLPVN